MLSHKYTKNVEHITKTCGEMVNDMQTKTTQLGSIKIFILLKLLQYRNSPKSISKMTKNIHILN